MKDKHMKKKMFGFMDVLNVFKVVEERRKEQKRREWAEYYKQKKLGRVYKQGEDKGGEDSIDTENAG